MNYDDAEARRDALLEKRDRLRQRAEEQAAIVDSHVPTPGPLVYPSEGVDDAG